MTKRIKKKLIQNSTTKQLLVTIPKNAGLEKDDYVEIVRVPEMKAKK